MNVSTTASQSKIVRRNSPLASERNYVFVILTGLRHTFQSSVMRIASRSRSKKGDDGSRERETYAFVAWHIYNLTVRGISDFGRRFARAN